jgi:hypothetical protein
MGTQGRLAHSGTEVPGCLDLPPTRGPRSGCVGARPSIPPDPPPSRAGGAHGTLTSMASDGESVTTVSGELGLAFAGSPM